MTSPNLNLHLHTEDRERNVVGSLVVYPEHLAAVRSVIGNCVEAFMDSRLRSFYTTMLLLADEGHTFTPEVLARESGGKVELGFLGDLTSDISTAHLLSDARAVIDAFRKRKPEWPEPFASQALHGLPGDFVRLVEPHTEADPAALLFSFLAAAGAALGREAYYEVSGVRHAPNLFTALIGASATARKGTSYAPVERVIRAADDAFADSIASGLTSGEGLISHVRDASGPEDKGVEDKRLLIVEEELASALKAGSRQGSTLSPVLRSAWDGRPLRTMAKNSPCRANGAHIGVIAHCTLGELRETLHRVDVSNGFANRFLWPLVRRSKSLPDGGALPHSEIQALGERMRHAIRDSARPRRVVMNNQAGRVWREVYEPLNQERPGAFGAVTTRGPAQVLRLSLVYALLDLAPTISPEHLAAALAVWKYADESARLIFREQEEREDKAVARVRSAILNGDGATRTALRELFSGEQRDEKLDRALDTLFTNGEIESFQVATGGRSATVYRRKGAA